MYDVHPALLWLIGTLVAFLAALVGVIYINVIKAQDKADERLEAAKKQLFSEISRLKESVSRYDTTHQVLCQKHEDIMEAQTRQIERIDGKLQRTAYTVAELDARVRNLDNKPSSLK